MASRGTKKARKRKTPQPTIDLFVAEYMVDRNATRAALRCGFPPASAKVRACLLLKTPEVAALVAEAVAEEQEHCKTTKERLVAEIGKIAYCNPGSFVRVRGKGHALMTIPAVAAHDRAAMGSVAGKMKMVKINTKDKLNALALLAKIHGWLDPEPEKPLRPRPIIRIGPPPEPLTVDAQVIP